MAVLANPSGPLSVGASGTLQGDRFTVLGRVRYGYSQGFWDEWYVLGEDGEPFWIGEDEYEFTVTRVFDVDDVPAWEDCEAGATIRAGERAWHVDERDVARCEGGEGQLPFVVTQDEETRFVDLSNAGLFATIEWGDDGARYFVGRSVPVKSIQMDYDVEGGDTLEAERAASAGGRRRVVKKGGREVSLNCESCGAPPSSPPPPGATSMTCEFCSQEMDLELDRVTCSECGAGIAIHSAEASSVGCPNCGARHEVAKDGLHLLAKLDKKKIKMPLAVGMKGNFRGRDWRIVGHVRAKEVDEGQVYYANSFCAFNEDEGYAWFEFENGHPSFNQAVRSAPANFNVRGAAARQKFQLHGTRWVVFERGTMTIDHIEGELSWVASVGDRTGYMDAISPPFMLCAEWSEGDGGRSEMEWSRSEWLEPEELEKAFGLNRGAVTARGVAPHQPYPHSESDKAFGKVGFLTVLVNLAFIVWVAVAGRGREIAQMTLQPADYAQEFITEEFTVTGGPALCRATFEAPVDNAWVYFDCALIDAQDNALLEFSAECSYYHGRDSDGGWSEGSRSDDVDFKVEKPGTYRLLVKGGGGIGNATGGWPGPPVQITLKEGVRQFRWAIIVLVLGIVVLVVVAIRKGSFQSKKWGESE